LVQVIFLPTRIILRENNLNTMKLNKILLFFKHHRELLEKNLILFKF